MKKKYDFAMAWSVNSKEHFIGYLKKACKDSSFSFLLINNDNCKEIIQQLEKHELYIRMLLDTEATYNKPKDIYSRLCYAVKDNGGVVINDPDRAKLAIDKSATHYELLNANLTTPYTVIVRNWEPSTFKLTKEERKKLGVPFIIKPAYGYGQLGVVRNAKGSIREIAQARNYDKGDNFLLQEKIIPKVLNGKRAWFRVLNVFDCIMPCWWDDVTNIYEYVTYEEFNSLSLYPLTKIVAKVAEISRMVWFSTEIAIDEQHGTRRFVVIDYVNDQCDMTTKTESHVGLPDEIVQFTSKRIVVALNSTHSKESLKGKYIVKLKDVDIMVRGVKITSDVVKSSNL